MNTLKTIIVGGLAMFTFSVFAVLAFVEVVVRGRLSLSDCGLDRDE